MRLVEFGLFLEDFADAPALYRHSGYLIEVMRRELAALGEPEAPFVKLVVEMRNSPTPQEYPYANCLSVGEVRLSVRESELRALPPADLKRRVLDLIADAVRLSAAQEPWEVQPLVNAIARIREQDPPFEYRSK